MASSLLGREMVKELLGLWHAYRNIIILVMFGSLLTIRVILQLRRKGEKLSTSPVPRSPALKSTIIKDSKSLLASEKDELRQQEASRQYGKVEHDVQKEAKFPAVFEARSRINASNRARSGPKRVTGSKLARGLESQGSKPVGTHNDNLRIEPLIFYLSETGSTRIHTTKLMTDLTATIETINSLNAPARPFILPRMIDLSTIDYDEYFLKLPKPSDAEGDVKLFYIFLIPSYNIDTVLDTFLEHLQETHHDFRIDTAPLCNLVGYSVFGLGDKDGWPTEEEGFCSQAREVDKWMAKLSGGRRAFPLGTGDVKSDAVERREEWRQGVEEALKDILEKGGLGEGIAGSGAAIESDEEDIEEAEDEELLAGRNRMRRRKLNRSARTDDVEDLGRIMRTTKAVDSVLDQEAGPLPIDYTVYGKQQSIALQERKDMVPKSSPTYNALTKQGYTIVGSHSGVKICRWTKSALRGRGSCYKYSFYGIKSHLCMETTPSLSCSNKCVFCWRHGTNPVGTTWRWKVDPPEMIFDGVKEGHYRKIKMMKGVPGVRAERFAEAMRIRHCALSLVGEPIFYPHINEFTAMLHKERISSFLVCNAQHPDQLEALKPVTQLYVSIDASNRESLKKIDRPLHRDFWERFERCLDILRQKTYRQRTVFRLTLVKGFNIEDEAEGYADLVEKGLPCFVEVKGVTYCGTSSSAGAGLTMQNVPFYEEVVAFVLALNKALERRGLSYGIAAEHAHSCCILIASTRFYLEDRWHTIIDYDKFFELLESGQEFAPEDYVGPPTPEWANFGNGGFDPTDQRVYRKGKNKGMVAETAIEQEEGRVDG
ncbi:MAG: hypothetical protein M1827_002445 [Pycnora praestabilis]|nr:MAG: hypothetical protein M1827_002445 [Pycnora praestabilis]